MPRRLISGLCSSPLTLVVGALSLAAGLPLVSETVAASPGRLLELNGDVPASGEWWRLLTAHVVHFTPGHLWLDLAAFGLLGAACEKRLGRSYPLLLIVGAVLIAGGLVLAQPDLGRYRGLSGLVSAQFAALVTLWASDARRSRDPSRRAIPIACAILFGGKIVYEIVQGKAFFSTSLAAAGVVACPTAHLLGACAGLAVCAFHLRLAHLKRAGPKAA